MMKYSSYIWHVNFRFPPCIIIISTFINQIMHSIDTVVDVGICRQIPITHIISTCEPSHVISIKYRLTLPGWIRCDPKHVGVIFNVCFLDFYTTQILTSTTVSIECGIWLIKVLIWHVVKNPVVSRDSFKVLSNTRCLSSIHLLVFTSGL